MNEINSLLLFVDVIDILNVKVELKETNSYDSIKEKNKQVANNLINNSRVLYNNIINNKIDEEIDNRIHSIEDIKCNAYNQNEYIDYKIILKRKTIVDFRNYVNSKCGEKELVNLEINNIMDKTIKEYFKKQQQTTTKDIIFNGRKPRTFVLKRLEKIGKELENEEGVIFTDKRLKEIISIILENPVERTQKTYLQCLIDFAIQNGRAIAGFDVMKYNLQGFDNAVKELMKK